MTTATEQIQGTYVLDPIHSSASFAVKHMVVSTFRGRFEDFDAYWRSAEPSNTLRAMFEGLDAGRRDLLRANVRRRVRAGDGELVVSARENAVRGINAAAAEIIW